VRREGANLVVLLSHNGFAIDRKLASLDFRRRQSKLVQSNR
jgi:2',3'-cyclic-nucleotide 2'-phosphodiesterase (5'-nucleotidase family)